MRRIEYNVCSSKIDSDKNIAICSDLHIEPGFNEKKLSKIIETLYEIEPTHIVLPGDLYNCTDNNEYNPPVSAFIEKIISIADTYYVIGNSEQATEHKNSTLPYDLQISNNPKFHLLGRYSTKKDKYISNDVDINFVGLDTDLEAYSMHESERCAFLKETLRKKLRYLSARCSHDTFNVLLFHDPLIAMVLMSLESENGFDSDKSLNYDLVISGHNHGGLFPIWMKPFFKISQKENLDLLYPTFTKGMIQLNPLGGHLIISKGITKFHSKFGMLHKFDNLHGGTIENVRIRKKD